MKQFYLNCLCLFLIHCVSLTTKIAGQCPVSVNAGEDVYLCAPLTPVSLNPEINGPYFDSKWSPLGPLVYPTWLTSPLNITQTTSFILTVRSFDPGGNLVVNPDFEQGNVGFTSALTYSPGNLVPFNTYDVLPNPQSANDTLVPCGDHTSGGGNMLATNMPEGSFAMWCQSIPVTPNTEYYYSWWMAKINPTNTGASRVAMFINGYNQNLISNDAEPCDWRPSPGGIWNSGTSTVADICIVRTKYIGAVALDDIFFGPACTVRDTVTFFLENPIAKALPDKYTIPCAGAEITLSGAGSSTGAQFAYDWTTSDGNIVSGHNSLYPIINAAGTYTLTLSLPGGLGPCIKTASVEVTEANNFGAWINAPTNLSCNASTILQGATSQPGFTQYAWTASAGGNIVSGQNAAFAQVNTPGTYTLLATNTQTGCTAEASVIIQPPNSPDVSIQVPGFLYGTADTIQLFASADPGTVTYSWTSPDGNLTAGATTASPYVSAPGTYVLTVVNTATGCSATASVQVNALPPCPLGVSAGPDTFLCNPAQPTALNGAINGAFYDLAWSPGQYLSDPFSLNPVATIDQTTEFVLEASMYFPNQNLIINANFENGNVGFTSDLTYNPDSLSLPGKYAILNNTSIANPAFPSCSDHGPGTGKMLIANLSNQTGPQHIFCQELVVKPDKEYLFSARVLQLVGSPTLQILVNSDTLGSIALTPDSCSWLNFKSAWYSDMHTSAEVCITSSDTSMTLALDDLFFTPLCLVQDTVLVELAETPVVAVAEAPETLRCVVESIVLNATASSPGLTYYWSTANGHIAFGENTLEPVVDASGAYQLLVTDTNNGCTATTSVDVEQDIAVPEIGIAAPATLNCLLSAQTLLAQNTAPAGDFSYLWTSSNGGNITGGANTVQAEIDAPGTYTLLATNMQNGCTSTSSVAVVQDIVDPQIEVPPPAVFNCFLAEQTLNGQNLAPAGNFSYQWTATAGGNITGGANSLQPEVDAAGTYTLLATNQQNGCTASIEITVIGYEDVAAAFSTQSDVSCFGVSDGVLALDVSGGDGNYTYSWNLGAGMPALNNLPAGQYSLTIADGQGCSAVLHAEIIQPDELLPMATATPPTVAGAGDGTATANPLGGTLPYTFEWSNGSNTASITGLASGFYTVTVTDAHGCTAWQTVQVWDGACNLATQVTATDPACQGAASGSATAQPMGGSAPFTYTWNNGATGETVPDLAAGTYTVTVTDVNDCAATATVSLNDPPLLTLELEVVTNASCPGTPDGAASVLAAGGSGNLSVVWSNDQQGPVATALTAGNYTATVSDENSCTATLSVTIQAIDLVPPTLQGVASTLELGPAGTISLSLQNIGVTVSDNCSVNEVEILPGSFDCLQLGTQTVTVIATDASGNSASLSLQITVVDNLPPQVQCPENIRQCADNSTVLYDAPVATDNCLMLGGVFDLLEGQPSGTAFPIGETLTKYTFIDASGNIGYCSFLVTIHTPINVALEALSHDVGGQGIGGIQVSVSGSQPGYLYEWTRSGQPVATTEDLAGLGAGAYSLLVTDSEGCTTIAGPFLVDDLVGTDSPDWAHLVTLYPNPSSGMVYVILPEAVIGQDLRFTIVDATGRLVLEQAGKGQKQTVLDWTTFADGLYTLLIRTEQGQAAFKVVLDR